MWCADSDGQDSTAVDDALIVVLLSEVKKTPFRPSENWPSGLAFFVASRASSMLGPTPVLVE